MEKLGLHFSSATENFDTVTPGGRAMLRMLATFAGFERDTLIQRTPDGKIKWAKAGCWLGGLVPHGYTLTTIEGRRFLVPATEIIDGYRWSEAGIVDMIFRCIAEEKLTSWATAGRLNVMETEAYPRQVAPIISQDLWDAAQRQMDDNRARGGRPTGAQYLLKGLIRCVHCNCNYIGTMWPFGQRRPEGLSTESPDKSSQPSGHGMNKRLAPR